MVRPSMIIGRSMVWVLGTIRTPYKAPLRNLDRGAAESRMPDEC